MCFLLANGRRVACRFHAMADLLGPVDYYIFFGSLVLIMAVGLWAGRREESSSDYFLAGRDARWWGVAGSIFGSNVSANHLVGMMGVGFAFGFAQSHFEITAIAGLLMLCYLFLPVYRKLNIYTLSEYLGKRYDDRCRIAYAVIMLLVIVVIQMVPGFYIGSRSINILMAEDTGQKAVARAVVDSNGTVTGGLILNAGRGYMNDPVVKLPIPPNGQAAKVKAVVTKNPVGAIVIKDTGTGYTDAPVVTFSGNGNARAKAVVKEGRVAAIQIVNGGSGYTELPTVTISPSPNGKTAEAFSAVVDRGVSRIEVIHGGDGYSPEAAKRPPIKFTGGAKNPDLSPGDVNPTHYIIGILIMALITGTYTIFGGLKAVIITDVIQSVLMLVAGLVLAFFMFQEIGGWSAMVAMDAAGQDKLHLYNAADHPALPWSGVLTGLMVLHFYYWGTNQFIVQRALAARSDEEARMGIISAGFFKLLIPFFAIGCGIAAWYYYADKAQVVAQDAVFMELLGDLVAPVGFGLVGLIAAGVIGAILSSIDSMLNSGATIMTMDVYKRYINPDAPEKKLISTGRLWVLIFLIAAALLTIFTMDPNSEDSFFLQIASHQSKLVAGVVVAFLLGMCWKRATGAGGLAAIFCGVAFSYGLPYLYPHIASEAVIKTFGEKLNFMHSVFIAAVISFIVHIIVSLMTQPDKEKAEFTWEGLGLFQPGEFRYFVIKIGGSLAVYAMLAGAMLGGMLTPVFAGVAAAGWTMLMFMDSLVKGLLQSAAQGEARNPLKDDRLWAGLLAACAVFMMYYFK